jgi:hypothetical protein
VIKEGEMDVQLRSDSPQTFANLSADLRHLGVVASVPEKDQ